MSMFVSVVDERPRCRLCDFPMSFGPDIALHRHESCAEVAEREEIDR